MMCQGNDILRLLPQRKPFLMVDTLEVCDGNSAVTTLAVRLDNYFMLADGTMSETGIIEHIAQSCSALAGSQARPETSPSPPVGIIGEVKHFVCHRRPYAGEQLRTTVAFDMTFGNVTIATGGTSA
jgi:predicted hotdog family 3-hydroxylacyl-ACP dehydratase